MTFVDQFNESADILIEKLSHKADGKTEVAMLDEFNRTTLDIIAKVDFIIAPCYQNEKLLCVFITGDYERSYNSRPQKDNLFGDFICRML